MTTDTLSTVESFLIETGRHALRAFRYRGGSKGNLIMIPDWAGATTASAHLLAQQYARTCEADVVLTDLYGADFVPYDYELADPIIQETMADPLPMRARIVAMIEALSDQWSRKGRPTVAVGFCFGGSLVFEAARAGAELDAAISVHGMPVSAAPLSRPLAISAGPEFILCQGASDPFITDHHLHTFEQEMQSTGRIWSLIKFGHTKHSFTRADLGEGNFAMGYNARADQETRMLCRNTFERLATQCV